MNSKSIIKATCISVALMLLALGVVWAGQNYPSIAYPFGDSQRPQALTQGASDFHGLIVGTKGVGDPVNIESALFAGANYIKHAQADVTEDNAGNGNPDADPDDGGWDWVLTAPTFVHSANASEKNLYGVTAMGLYYAYLKTGNDSLKTAMQDAATIMIGDAGIRTASDLIFLMRFQDLSGVTPDIYKDAAKTKFDARITTYGSATALAVYIRDLRHSQGYDNGIIPWDIGAWAVAAQMLEDLYPSDPYDYAQAADDIAEVLYQDSYNGNMGYFDPASSNNNGWDPTYNTPGYWWYTLGITGLLDAFKAANVHTDKIPGLLTILLACQYSGGAFSYCYGANTDDEDWQSSAYAVLSLARVDLSTYQTEINHACYWIGATQDGGGGGWVYSSGNHYPEIGGECTSALYFGQNASEVWVDDDYTPGGYNDGHMWGYDAFDNIQDGIDAVSGSTVNVAAGTYTENVDVNKQVTIIGTGEANTIVTAANNQDHVFEVTADGVSISNLTATGANYPSYTYREKSGIFVKKASGTISNVTINSVTARNNNIGISLKQSSGSTVTGCTATNNIMYGIYLEWSDGNVISSNNASSNGQDSSWAYSQSNAQIGIYLKYSSNNDLTGNTANSNKGGTTRWGGTAGSYSGIGIFLYLSCNSNVLIGNTANNNECLGNTENSGIGIYLWQAEGTASDHTVLTDNTANGNKYKAGTARTKSGSGIILYQTHYADLTGNIVNGNQENGYYSEGAIANFVHDNTMTGTTTTGNKIGLYLVNDASTYSYNTITGNTGDGVRLDYYGGMSVTATALHYNNISGNGNYGANNIGTGTDILNAEKNWWGDATGPDDDDGIINGSGDKISTNVDAKPWYATSTTTPTTEYVTVTESPDVRAYSDSIQAGINAAVDGNTVNVVAGTYHEAGTFPDGFGGTHAGLKFDNTKGGITLRGANAGTPGTGTRGAESIIEGPNVEHGNAIYIFNGADGVIVDGFTLKAGDDIVENRADNVVIKNNIITPISGIPFDTQAPGIFACECSNLTVAYNLILDIGMRDPTTGGAGIYLGLSGGGYPVSNSLIEHNLIDNSNGTGILAFDTQGGGITIRYNTIRNVGTSGSYHDDGIRAGALGNGLTIQYNEIYGCTQDGIDIRHDATTHHINYNSIHDNDGYGVTTNQAGPVDASGNWLGSNDAVTVAGEVSANIDYTPWLHDGTDQGGDPGFQPDLSYLHVDDTSPQSGTTGRIQEGVDMVAACTVYVEAGTYNEEIYINKSLTLSGAGRDVTTINSPGTNVTIELVANGITVEGFTITGSTGRGIDNHDTGGRIDITIKNNRIEGNSDCGMYINPSDLTCDNIEIRGNIFEDNGAVGGQGGLYLTGGTGIQYTNLVVVDNQFINNTGQGAGVELCDNATITGNTVTGTLPGGDQNGVGMYLSFGIGGDIRGNTANNNAREGIMLWQTDGATVCNNNSHDNNGAGLRIAAWSGVAINNVVTGNNFTGNVRGIELLSWGKNHVYDNELHQNNIAGNLNYGVYNDNSSCVDASTNWWGSVDGPKDSIGTDEATFTQCYDVSTMKNTVAELSGTLGNKVTENVDYCPWLGGNAGFDAEIYAGCNDPCNDFCLDFKLSGTDIRFFHFEYPLPSCIDKVSSTGTHPNLVTFYTTMFDTVLHIDGTFDPNFTGSNVKIGSVCFTHDGGCPNSVKTLICTYDEVRDGNGTLVDVSPGQAIINVDNTVPDKTHPTGNILPCYNAPDDPDWACWNLGFYKGVQEWQCKLLQANIRIYKAAGCNPSDLIFTHDFFTAPIPGDFTICYPTNQAERDAIWNAIYPSFGDGTYYVRITAKDSCCNEADNCDAFTFCTDTYTENYITCVDAKPAHNHICLEWNYTADPTNAVKLRILRSPYRAGNYPEYAASDPAPTGYDDPNWYVVYEGTDTYPCTGASWFQDGGFTNDTRDIYWYAGFTQDAAGNWSSPDMTVGTGADRATSYWLGDVADIPGAGGPDGLVFGFTGDVGRLSSHYGTTPTTPPPPVWDNTVDYGPETQEHGIGRGIPIPDDVINYKDLLPFSFNYNIVGPSGECSTWPLLAQSQPARQFSKNASQVSVWLKQVSSNQPGGVTFALMLTNPGDAIHLFHSQISYNSNALSLMQVRRGEVGITQGSAEFFAHPNTGDGLVDVDLAALGPDAYVVGSGAVAYLDFSYKATEIPSKIALKETILYDGEGNEIDLSPTDVEVENQGEAIPTEFALYYNHPNPFNPTTTIKYDLPQVSYVKLVVYNVMGQKVATLVDGMVEAGRHQVIWDAKDVSSGVYFYRINAGNFTQMHKMILLK